MFIVYIQPTRFHPYLSKTYKVFLLCEVFFVNFRWVSEMIKLYIFAKFFGTNRMHYNNKTESIALCFFQSDGSSLPQPVEVRVCCLRATRDKLPRGLYSIRVTLHSRLGGSTLAFRGLNKQQDAGMSTEPTEHRGRFYHNDLPINQSLFMVVMISVFSTLCW